MTVDPTLIERYDGLIRRRWETFDQSVSRLVHNHGSFTSAAHPILTNSSNRLYARNGPEDRPDSGCN